MVKDPVLSLLWLRFDPWPGNFHILKIIIIIIKPIEPIISCGVQVYSFSVN